MVGRTMRIHRTRWRRSGRNEYSDPDVLQFGGEFAHHVGKIFGVFDDAIGAHLGWFDEFVVHRSYRCVELSANTLGRPAAFVHIASETAFEAQFTRSCPEDLVRKPFDQLWEGEEKNALGDDDVGRWQDDQVIGSLVTGEVIDRKRHIKPLHESIEVMAVHLGVERIGVIEVDRVAFLHGEAAQVLVIRVERKDRDSIVAKSLSKVDGESGFSGSAAARYPDEESCHEYGRYRAKWSRSEPARQFHGDVAHVMTGGIGLS